MEKKQQFEEQDAPLKNTDKSFVQVGEDGSPHMPESATDNESNEGKEEKDKPDFANR